MGKSLDMNRGSVTPIERSPVARLLAGVAGALLGGGMAAGIALSWGLHPALWMLPALGALSGVVSGDRGIKRLVRIVTMR